MTNLGPRQERQAMVMAQTVRLNALALENYFTGGEAQLIAAYDEEDAIARLDIVIQTAQTVKNMLIKANESVTKS